MNICQQQTTNSHAQTHTHTPKVNLSHDAPSCRWESLTRAIFLLLFGHHSDDQARSFQARLHIFKPALDILLPCSTQVFVSSDLFVFSQGPLSKHMGWLDSNHASFWEVQAKGSKQASFHSAVNCLGDACPVSCVDPHNLASPISLLQSDALPATEMLKQLMLMSLGKTMNVSLLEEKS